MFTPKIALKIAARGVQVCGSTAVPLMCFLNHK